MIEKPWKMAQELALQLVTYRRDFHRYAESGWTEFRTASLIARRLADLGCEVQVGRKVICEQDRMGVPSADVLEECWQRAKREGGDPEFLGAVRGGFTGVVGIIGGGKGPVVGLRFDIDALDVGESTEADHRPFRECFASVHDGVSHACGHDAHAAVGLGVAEILARLSSNIRGTVKLIFQPAEEGVRGAKSMVEAGIVDDVDYIIGHHVYSGWSLGEICGGVGGYLATEKFDALFSGSPAHAAGAPQRGRNALLAAANAVLNLYAISRHRDGTTRVNVGRLTAGSGRNVIPAEAHLVAETRGATTELNEYMYARALSVLEASAAMYDCTLEVRSMGSARSAWSSPELAERVERIAQQLGGYTTRTRGEGGGSEDFTYMMKRVQDRGRQATNIGIGADLGGWGSHTDRFDIDERALVGAAGILSSVVMDILSKSAVDDGDE